MELSLSLALAACRGSGVPVGTLLKNLRLIMSTEGTISVDRLLVAAPSLGLTTEAILTGVGALAGGAPMALTTTGAIDDLPIRIPGCLLWLDASDTGTITASSGSVSQWDDKSGNDHHVAQTAGAAQPTTGTRTIDGKNVIDFDSAYLTRDDALGLTGNPNFCMFCVVKLDTSVAIADGIMSVGSATDPTTGKVIGCCAGSDGYSYRYLDGNQVFNATVLGSAKLLNYCRASGAQYGAGALFVEGTSQSETSESNPTSTPNLADEHTSIGSLIKSDGSFDSFLIDGVVAEVLVYNTAMASADRQLIEGYLAWKWGLEASLPSGHPYESSAP